RPPSTEISGSRERSRRPGRPPLLLLPRRPGCGAAYRYVSTAPGPDPELLAEHRLAGREVQGQEQGLKTLACISFQVRPMMAPLLYLTLSTKRRCLESKGYPLELLSDFFLELEGKRGVAHTEERPGGADPAAC